MKRFAELLDRLSYEPGRNNKLRLMTDYFRHTPDPDRGYALAALTGALSFQYAKPNVLRTLIDRAHRPGAVRPVARLCRRHLGDDRADVAGAVRASAPHSAPLPRERGRGGVGGEAASRSAPHPHPSPPLLRMWVEGGAPSAATSSTTRSPSLTDVVATIAPSAKRNCPRSSRAGSMRSTRPAAGRCSSSSPARCASASRRGSPRPRPPRSATRTCRRSS